MDFHMWNAHRQQLSDLSTSSCTPSIARKISRIPFPKQFILLRNHETPMDHVGYSKTFIHAVRAFCLITCIIQPNLWFLNDSGMVARVSASHMGPGSPWDSFAAYGKTYRNIPAPEKSLQICTVEAGPKRCR